MSPPSFYCSCSAFLTSALTCSCRVWPPHWTANLHSPVQTPVSHMNKYDMQVMCRSIQTSHLKSCFKDFHALVTMNSAMPTGRLELKPCWAFLNSLLFFQLVRIPTRFFFQEALTLFYMQKGTELGKGGGLGPAVKFHLDLNKWNGIANLHLWSLDAWQSLFLFCLPSSSAWIRRLPAQLVIRILLISHV